MNYFCSYCSKTVAVKPLNVLWPVLVMNEVFLLLFVFCVKSLISVLLFCS